MIKDAIVLLKERTGANQYAIQKFIEEKHKEYSTPSRSSSSVRTSPRSLSITSSFLDHVPFFFSSRSSLLHQTSPPHLRHHRHRNHLFSHSPPTIVSKSLPPYVSSLRNCSFNLLQSGPGCSSIASGAAQAQGPFLVHSKGGNLTFNKFSWNKEANILFLEASVGVGFSNSNNSTDLQNLGDQVTAQDSFVFLINWFKKFPEFRSNEFYITGQSYAGHYVPQLAEVIYDRNKKVARDSRINLKGIMTRNPVLNEPTDAAGIVDYAWSHALISDDVHKHVHDSCRFGDKLTPDGTAQCNKSFTGFTA
ncbi:Alpha/Beta hydrolase fold protein [Raphanus sativus]|nr:Alpha/Beta hydrolase fold protein [Raphanus sativus]